MVFNVLKQFFVISWKLLVKYYSDSLALKCEVCFFEKCRNYRRLKTTDEIWSPGEIGLFAIHGEYLSFRTRPPLLVILGSLQGHHDITEPT